MNSPSQNLKHRIRSAAFPVLICTFLFLTSLPKSAAQQGAQDTYNHKCAVCHGQDGLGNTAKGKKSHVKDVHANMKDSETDMIKVVTDGKGDDMDSYKADLTASQIKDIVDYYRSLGQK